MKTYQTYYGEQPVLPQPEGVEWRSPEWQEWWKSLNHDFCTQMIWTPSDDTPMHERCRSIHCHLCGQSTSSQGHLDRDGKCPNV